MTVCLRLRQGGKTVASVDAVGMVEAEAEAFHYAKQYRNDGQVVVQILVQSERSRFWKRYALFERPEMWS